MIPVESLKFIKELADAANPAKKIVPAPAEPKDHYYLEGPDGSLTLVKAQPPAGQHTAASIETLVTWAGSQPNPAVWYSRTKVVAGTRPADPSSPRCTFPLQPSPQFAYLAAVEQRKGESFDQAGLIRTLRTTLAGCWGGDLLANVRKVNISKAKAVESEQQKGKVSLSRKDLAEMSGANDLPDEVAFDVPVFANGTVPVRAAVRVAIELNPETERFILTTLPGQTEAAFTKGEGWLLQEIVEQLGKAADTTPVYHGDA